MTTVVGVDVHVDQSCVVGAIPRANAANRRPVDLNLSAVRLGDRTIVNPFACIYLDAHLGPDCIVGNHASIREGCRIGARCVIGAYADLQYNVHLGDDVRIMNGAHITGGTIIGSGTFISVDVATANHRRVDLDAYDVPPQGHEAPIIGRNVMVGVGAIILPGVTIGDFAVIAAGAVVTKNVAAHTTVAGLPARADWRKPQ